jgi:uncharacterized protein (TIGR03435 family)
MTPLFFRVLILFFIIFAKQASAQESLIGTKSPELTFAKVLNEQDSTYNLSKFAGKVVLLDFWATWCRPCIEGFPKLEALQKEFPNDLKIITITSDNEKRIKTFLEKKKTSLPIAIDLKDALAKIFPHTTIPHMVLIDSKGIIRAIANSSQITKEVISALIKGQNIQVEEKKDVVEFNPSAFYLGGTPTALSQITVTNFRKGLPNTTTAFRNGKLTIINMLPQTIYETLYDFPNQVRSVWEADQKKAVWTEGNLYCVEIIALDKTEKEAKNMLIQHLQGVIPVKVRIEKREIKVKILQKMGKESKIEVAKADQETFVKGGGKTFEMQNSPIKTLTNYIEDWGQVAVVDETNLTQNYNLKIAWYHESLEKVSEELKKIGLELVDGKRKADILVFYE